MRTDEIRAEIRPGQAPGTRSLLRRQNSPREICRNLGPEPAPPHVNL